MEVQQTEIPGLLRIVPFISYDARGYFIKDYSDELFRSVGVNLDIREVFYAKSSVGVIRGIHFQRSRQQTKLVRCLSGKIFDVIVDLRPNSPSFKRWLAFTLSEDNHEELLIPGGCGHGYLVLEKAIVSYKCDEVFVPECDDGVIWNDHDLQIQWPLTSGTSPTLSKKDSNLQTFRQFIDQYGGLV